MHRRWISLHKDKSVAVTYIKQVVSLCLERTMKPTDPPPVLLWTLTVLVRVCRRNPQPSESVPSLVQSRVLEPSSRKTLLREEKIH